MESRLHLDISSINSTGLGGSKYWCLVVDAQTKMKWSFFLKEKSDQTSKLIPFLKDLRNRHKKNVQFIRCDNSGENRTLQSACQQAGIQAHFEFTPPGTPQHNGVVERAFATLYGRVRAMMSTAGLTLAMRNALWTECANTATDIDNVIVSNQESPHKAFFNTSNSSQDRRNH